MNEIDFNDVQSLKQNGFEGFNSIQELKQPKNAFIPKDKGVYLVVCPFGFNPKFLIKSTGGHSKGRNPTVYICEVEKKWIDNTKVLYIGKAASDKGNSNLNDRIQCYLKFGSGEKVGHWGGRYIRQIENSHLLQLCWKPTPDENPGEIETHLILKFENQFGRLPFANLRH